MLFTADKQRHRENSAYIYIYNIYIYIIIHFSTNYDNHIFPHYDGVPICIPARFPTIEQINHLHLQDTQYIE